MNFLSGSEGIRLYTSQESLSSNFFFAFGGAKKVSPPLPTFSWGAFQTPRKKGSALIIIIDEKIGIPRKKKVGKHWF